MSQQPNVGDTVEKARRFSPALFGIIAICFLLPFVAITCSGQELFSLSGLDLVTGTEVGQDDLASEFTEGFNQLEEGFGGETTTETEAADEETAIDPEPAAILALALAVIGLIAGFALKGDRGALVSALAGILGVLALLALRMMFKVEDPAASAEELQQAEAIIGYEWGMGWWLAFLLFLAQPILHFTALKGLRSGGKTTHTGSAPPPADPPPAAGGTGGGTTPTGP